MKITELNESLKRLGPDMNDPYEQGWFAKYDDVNPYEKGTSEHDKWQDGHEERLAQPDHYNESMDEGAESENLAIGEKMARDGIEYDPAREGEIISMIGDYLRRDGMTTRQVRGYMMDNDFVSDQLSYLPRKSDVAEGQLDEKWSKKYKDSINCSNPKGFSQKAHCAGRKKNESVTEKAQKCPGCGGPLFTEMMINEKKDACYYKVKSRYKVWPSAYASGALVKCRKKGAKNWGTGGKKNESIEELEENLHKWFKEKWVRFGPDGKIRGDCARGSDSEGKPKCLPQSKAHNLGKKARASAAARKRREDPNPERTGKAINVNTKKKSNESISEDQQYKPQYSSKEEAIQYAKEKVKTFSDWLDGIEIWEFPNGGFDVVHTMNSNGRNHVIKNGGKKIGTVYRKKLGVAENNWTHDPWKDKYFGPTAGALKKIFKITVKDSESNLKAFNVKAETEQQAKDIIEKHDPGSTIVSIKFVKNLMAFEQIKETSNYGDLDEVAPPGQEDWIRSNKARFKKEYGDKKGEQVLYATAWKRSKGKK